MDSLEYILDNYSDEYAEFIMEHAAGDRIICNGDTLLEAMEEGYVFEEFITHAKATYLLSESFGE